MSYKGMETEMTSTMPQEIYNQHLMQRGGK
jgi:hypothetical protein